jgi:hypothetical protein
MGGVEDVGVVFSAEGVWPTEVQGWIYDLSCACSAWRKVVVGRKEATGAIEEHKSEAGEHRIAVAYGPPQTTAQRRMVER